MRIILLIFLILTYSCSKYNNKNIIDKINISDNLSFDEFRRLIEKKSLNKDYPDIDKWKKK
mgnify:FL=1